MVTTLPGVGSLPTDEFLANFPLSPSVPANAALVATAFGGNRCDSSWSASLACALRRRAVRHMVHQRQPPASWHCAPQD